MAVPNGILRDPTKLNLLLKEYARLEEAFIDLTEYVPITTSFNDPNFNFGSPRAAAFGLDSGTWVETCLDELLQGPRYDLDNDILQARQAPANIDTYRTLLEPRLRLAAQGLVTIEGKLKVTPFAAFATGGNPDWFRKYSKSKHRRIELADIWTLRDSVECLGALLILVRACVEIGSILSDASEVFESVFLPGRR